MKVDHTLGVYASYALSRISVHIVYEEEGGC